MWYWRILTVVRNRIYNRADHEEEKETTLPSSRTE